VTDQPVEVHIAPYSTDAVEIVSRLEVPVIIYGPGAIEQAHQPDEYVEVSTLFEALEILTRFAVGVA